MQLVGGFDAQCLDQGTEEMGMFVQWGEEPDCAGEEGNGSNSFEVVGVVYRRGYQFRSTQRETYLYMHDFHVRQPSAISDQAPRELAISI